MFLIKLMDYEKSTVTTVMLIIILAIDLVLLSTSAALYLRADYKIAIILTFTGNFFVALVAAIGLVFSISRE